MGKRIIIIRRITYNDFIRFSSYVHHTFIDSVQTVGLCTIVTYLLLSKVRGLVAGGVGKQ